MRGLRPFPFSNVGERGRFGTRLQGLEQLENRNLLTVSIGNIQLATDTGVSSSDKISSVATLSGTTTGSPPSGGSAQVQFDHNGDGVVNGSTTVSSGAFSYNPLAVDSTLANWEAALTIRYRTRELNAYGGEVSVGDWQNFNMTLDRKAPTGSLAAVSVEQDAPNTNVSLHDAFADGVTPDAQLNYQIISNTNSNMFTSVSISSGTLTLNYDGDWYGTADIVIRATDQAGNTKDATLAVSVDHVAVPPQIVGFTIIESTPDTYQFYGSVIDDTDMTGYYVLIYVVETSDYLLAEIQSDGSFSIFFACTNPGAYATAITCDGEEQMSEEVWASFA